MKEIHRISITDAVVDSIKEMIESGEYPIGEKLPTETSLCDMLKVSRTSVREAVRVLQALGYVDLKPGKGAFVANYSAVTHTDNWYDVEDAKFYDFMEVRMAIETLSVRLSVERASAKQVHELEEIHQSFLEANESKDLVRLIMLDELFHTKIISFTRNQLLININKQLLECFRVYRGDSFTNKDVYVNAVEPHERILFCFQTRNAAQAVQEMRSHLEITSRDMEAIHNSHTH
ncbi:FadR family transcriptional regulator [Oscillibacter sp. MSJ-2]|uniref:FadR family transcriptional regulator n=1 Tax=Dysosmobacter acutus TaxID=2841504 RepID=A0ABS6F8M9_9FIRM|nr:FadR/GntR family transcriptional regulator [Dysosmobacter acutus]MBU5626428.1 FadR family transcriptional regulator [Dysosmobacter acutus]